MDAMLDSVALSASLRGDPMDGKRSKQITFTIACDGIDSSNTVLWGGAPSTQGEIKAELQMNQDLDDDELAQLRFYFNAPHVIEQGLPGTGLDSGVLGTAWRVQSQEKNDAGEYISVSRVVVSLPPFTSIPGYEELRRNRGTSRVPFEGAAPIESVPVPVMVMAPRVIFPAHITLLYSSNHDDDLDVLRTVPQELVLKFIESNQFQFVVALAILINCIALSFGSPSDQGLVRVLEWIDVVLSSFFAVEAALGIYAYTLPIYLGSRWRQLDLVVAGEGVWTMFAFFQGHSDDTGLGFLRSIRILRPLRSISRVPELKLAVEVLISALPSIGNAMILYAIFIVFASVFFLQLSAESLTHACVGPEFDDLEQVVFCSKEETSCIPGLFRANDCNGDRSACHILHKPIIYPDFENFGVSLLTTFRISMMDGWSVALWHMQNALGPNVVALFLVIIIVGPCIITNLCIAAILKNYTTAQEEVHRKQENEALVREMRTVGVSRPEEGAADPNQDENFQDGDSSDDEDEGEEEEEEEEKYDVRSVGSLDVALSLGSVPVAVEQREEDSRPMWLCAPPEEVSNFFQSQFSCVCASYGGMKNTWLRHLAGNDMSLLNSFMNLAILANILCMASESYDQSKEVARNFAITNAVFTILFLVETIFKLIVLGPGEYLSFGHDFINVVDIFVVIISTVELFLGGQSSVSVLRVLRIMRAARLLRMNEQVVQVIKLMGNSVTRVWPMVVLLLLFIFMMTVFGMQLFGDIPRDSTIGFRNFGQSLTNTVMCLASASLTSASFSHFPHKRFIMCLDKIFVMCLEDWGDQIEFATNGNASNPNSLFFVVVILFGQLLLLNLVLATIVDGAFEVFSSAIERQGKLDRCKRRLKKQMLYAAFHHFLSQGLLPSPAASPASSSELMLTNGGDDTEPVDLDQSEKKTRRSPRSPRSPQKNASEFAGFNFSQSISQQDENQEDEPAIHLPDWVLDAWFAWEDLCIYIDEHPMIDRIMDVVLLISCVGLLNTQSQTDDSGCFDPGFWQILDALCVWAFAFEMLARGGARGVVNGEEALLKDWWMILEVAINMSGVLAFVTATSCTQPKGLSMVFLIVRSFRPLRVVNRVESLKITFDSIVISLYGLLSLLALMMIFKCAFAIIGMQLFMGQFWFCEDEDFPEGMHKDGKIDDNGVVIQEPCESWTNPSFHYDNFEQAMLSSFTFSAGGWNSLWKSAINMSEEDHNQIAFNKMGVVIFFFVCVFIFDFYLKNLFIGVIFDTYMRISSMENGELLSVPHRRFKHYQKSVLKYVSPSVADAYEEDRPKRLRAFMESSAHGRFILGILLVNLVLLTMTSGDQPKWMRILDDAGNTFIAIVFVIDFACAIASYGFRIYLSRADGQFDTLVTITSAIDTCIDASTGYAMEPCPSLSFLRALRVLRLLKILDYIKDVKIFIKATRSALPSIIDLASLLFILILIAASLGYALFHDRYESGLEKGVFDKNWKQYSSFDSVSSALTELLILTTGDKWEDEMGQLEDAGSEKSKWVVVLYAVLFQIVGQTIFMNLFIMVIVEAYEVLEDESREIADICCSKFCAAWEKLDPEGTGVIDQSKVRVLLLTLNFPIGCKGSTSSVVLNSRIHVLESTKGYKPEFHWMMEALFKLYVYCDEEEMERIERSKFYSACAIVSVGFKRNLARVRRTLKARRKAMRRAARPKKEPNLGQIIVDALTPFKNADSSDSEDDEDTVLDLPGGGRQLLSLNELETERNYRHDGEANDTWEMSSDVGSEISDVFCSNFSQDTSVNEEAPDDDDDDDDDAEPPEGSKRSSTHVRSASPQGWDT